MRSVAVVTEFLGVVCPVGMTLVYVLGRVSSAGSGATTKLRVASVTNSLRAPPIFTHSGPIPSFGSVRGRVKVEVGHLDEGD